MHRIVIIATATATMALIHTAQARACPPVKIIDTSTATAAGMLAGPLAALAVGSPEAHGERAEYVAAVAQRVCREEPGLVGATLTFDGGRVTHTYVDGRTLVERIPVSIWPEKPREKWVLKGAQYVNVTPPAESQADAEARWLGEYDKALDRLDRRAASVRAGGAQASVRAGGAQASVR